MAVITIIIEESEEQLIFGVPRYVTLTPSISSTIFYTTDGSTPDTSSSVYIDTLELPHNQNTLTFKLFATNGTDSSAIITTIYKPDITILRQSHDTATINTSGSDQFPYGSVSGDPPAVYHNFGPSALIVDKPDVDNIFDGYDGTATGTSTGGTDLDLDEYLIKFSETNSLGQYGRGLGTLPHNVNVRQEQAAPLFSNMNDNLFNPRAMVIYQDSRLPSDPNISQVNRQYFSLDRPERTKDGILFNTTGLDGLIPTGSFVRSMIDYTNNVITYYYHDSQSLRWIISKEPYTAPDPRRNLANIIPNSRQVGANKVFKWVPFKGSRLI